MTDPVEQSAAFLRAVKLDEPVADYEDDIATLDSDRLATALDTDGARTAFWVNVYNAATQCALEADPDQYEDRRTFFSEPRVTVAGTHLSLDDIEHTILRRSYPKWTLGYLRWPFRDEFAEVHQPTERDPRIHFALNCGAESCPAIAAYARNDIDEQLDWTAEGYLDSTVEYDPEAGRALVPRVMLWFRGDFGGKRGILDMLERYDQIPLGASLRLSYREWDWSLDIGAFAEEEPAETD